MKLFRHTRKYQCLLFVFLFVASTTVHAGPLPRSTPEEQGISSSDLLAFVEAADQQLDSLHSLMLVRHGNVVAEGWWAPYRAELRHEMYSLSKSFTSTAVGFAVSEGKLSVHDPVVSFFPDELPDKPSANLKAMRVSDLLMMSAGHDKQLPAGAEFMTTKAFLAHPVPFKPGTHFMYNTPATFMLSAIVQKVTGQTILEYLQSRLFEPLGIEGATWDKNSQGISLGGYGLSIRTEDIAKFGQLYLQRGQWNGRQLLPASWIDAASARQTSNGSNPKSDWDQGYGYQFWRCRNGAYRGDGAFGQYCIVLPEQDAVLAITSGIGDMQSVLNLIWDKLLPAMRSEALPKNAESQSNLTGALAKLKLRTPGGSQSSPRFASNKTYKVSGDQQIETITIKPAELELKLVDGTMERIPFGFGTWAPGRARLRNSPERAIASSAAWTNPETLIVKTCAVETPFVTTWTLRFNGDELAWERESNVAFSPRKLPDLIGRIEQSQ
jgi:CubicO group peptidase (beta-lactamase class C family)